MDAVSQIVKRWNMNIFVAVMCIIVAGAGFFAWKVDNGGSDKKGSRTENEGNDGKENDTKE